ncbi:hypothetical protein, partial [Burkholderia pseudomallei]|uniref:hypothetical protein n=9 Tax=Burkholderia pseudomallei TaxID=28450 RepID=UPI001CC2F0FC
ENRPLPSSAHTYRLFIVKEHIREKIRLLTAPFSAALRCQQQRNEIMITYSQRVNNFFTTASRTAQITAPRPRPPLPPTVPHEPRNLPLPPSRRVRRSAKEA